MTERLAELIVPFSYDYMLKAMWVSALVGGVCAFLSAYLMLKGWSLMGDALSHSVVPGVAAAYILGAPFAVGAFFAGMLAALGMAFVKQKTRLREDAVIGVVFTSFFALGLLMASLYPTSVSIQTIVFGNILGISDEDIVQVAIIAAVTLRHPGLKWKDLMLTFFDENHARALGLNTTLLQVMFFTLLSACTVAALQTVGACLVVAMLVTPGATAYLLTDRFGRLIVIASRSASRRASSAPISATSSTARPAGASSRCRRCCSCWPSTSRPSTACSPRAAGGSPARRPPHEHGSRLDRRCRCPIPSCSAR